MKKLLITSLLGAALCCAGASAQSLTEGFAAPPDAARPYVWWHWMDGNVSKDGIVRDLTWLRRSGIAGVHQFDAGGISMPRASKVRYAYFSEGWKEMFRHALHVADSLGMEVTIASCPGWSSTGGTWVTPENAMKKLDWSTTEVVSKGRKADIPLPGIKLTVGPYLDYEQLNDRIKVEPWGYDLMVVAVRIPDAEKSMKELCESVSSSDSLYTFKLKQPTHIKAVTIVSDQTGGRPVTGKANCFNHVEYSRDGQNWLPLCDVPPCRVPYITVNTPPASAKYFRVRGRKLRGATLHTVNKVEHSQEQGAFANILDFHKYTTPSDAEAIAEKDVIVLGSVAEGVGAAQAATIRAKLPRGRWRIYRFGASITGKVNHPASPEATGLEVDKLDAQAWADYFRHYVDMYKEAAGGKLGAEGITHLLIDSYEAGSQTWTPKLPEEFSNRRGYELTKWLPALAGEVIGSAERTEKFLWDWRKTIGELYADNYHSVSSQILPQYGLKGLYAESHEGGRAFCGDGMDAKTDATIPMSAIWAHDTPEGSRIPAAIADIRESASVAHIYDKPIVAGESFTVEGSHQKAYTYTPEKLKYTADVAMSAGLNRFVIHESAAQPNDSYLPGLGLFRYGQWFQRHETWADYAYVWTDYLARSCYLLQQGNAVADILVYYGEDSNVTAQFGGVEFKGLYDCPQGFEYDFANPTVLKKMVEPVNGRLQTVSGKASYKILVLTPDNRTMSNEILRRLKVFADAGVVICGAEPEVCAGLMGNCEEFTSLVQNIWHSGRSNVVATMTEALKVSGLEPDFFAPDGLRYVHRKCTDGSNIYWVRNFSCSSSDVELDFRSGAASLAILDPVTGKAYRPADGSTINKSGRTKWHGNLESGEALFFVLSGSPMAGLEHKSEAKPVLREAFGGVHWAIDYDQLGGRKAHEEYNGSPRSWTLSTNPDVKYYAGVATYNTQFEVSASMLACSEVKIDFGTVKDLAEVIVNGQPAGVLWKTPFITEDIKALLHQGTNTIQVKVANVWVNRMIGDCRPDGGQPVTKVRRFYKATDPLLQSGLLSGPVVIGYSE